MDYSSGLKHPNLPRLIFFSFIGSRQWLSNWHWHVVVVCFGDNIYIIGFLISGASCDGLKDRFQVEPVIQNYWTDFDETITTL